LISENVVPLSTDRYKRLRTIRSFLQMRLILIQSAEEIKKYEQGLPYEHEVREFETEAEAAAYRMGVEDAAGYDEPMIIEAG
jgi:hypothetical protein